MTKVVESSFRVTAWPLNMMEEVGRAEAPSGPCPTNVPLTTKTSNRFSPGSKDIPVFKNFKNFKIDEERIEQIVVVSYKHKKNNKIS